MSMTSFEVTGILTSLHQSRGLGRNVCDGFITPVDAPKGSPPIRVRLATDALCAMAEYLKGQEVCVRGTICAARIPQGVRQVDVPQLVVRALSPTAEDPC